MANNEEETCFVIAPIGQEGSETRKRSDQVLGHVIRPAAEECGYQAIRADEISAPGLITDQIINHVLDDPMVVADLTDWNPNVFYELAVRHAFRKPFVLLFQPGPQKERIPFDVAGLRAVILDYPDWDSMVDSKAKLIEAMRAAEAMDERQVVTPITRAIDVQALTESKDPTANTLGELSSSVKRLDNNLSLLLASQGHELGHEIPGLLDHLFAGRNISASVQLFVQRLVHITGPTEALGFVLRSLRDVGVEMKTETLEVQMVSRS